MQSPTIGIITALPKEFASVRHLLNDCKEASVPGAGAGRRYVLGTLPSKHGGTHSVVLCLADMGNNIAATRATLLLEHFPTVMSVIMTGIAGGVPHPTVPALHVRLGDIVVSNWKGVIQYDMVELSEINYSPRPPSSQLLDAVRLLEADALEKQFPWERYIEAAMKGLDWKKPPRTHDRLFSSDDPATEVDHPADSNRRGVKPRVFLGAIASANELLKDPLRRDGLRDKHGVRAVEMETSGIADATWGAERGYLGIRGICDYCDSHKNYEWQEYAAVVAAAYTRALIESMPAPKTTSKYERENERVFEVPFHENPYFTGRDELLEELHSRLSKQKRIPSIQGVCGLGGIGKTQVALHYAYTYQKEYATTFWIRSDTTIQLTDGFLAIAKRLGLPYDETRRDEVIPVVRNWLAKNSNWLLIFDNADAPLILKQYLPNQGDGHIIVTSRVNKLDSIGVSETLELPKLPHESATDFLLHRTGRKLDSPERKLAYELAKEIDGLPLALEQAGAYINAMSVTFERYLANYREARNRIEFLDEQEPVAGDYDSTVATTWMVNFMEVEKESSASADLLRFSSFLDPDCIPFELIIHGASEIAPALHAAIEKADDPILAVLEALRPLARFSLVYVDRDNEMYSMHRLVQEVLKIRDDT